MNILNKYTLESLKKNRTRTIVTVIGIVLSVAMFTATTEAVTSIMNMMRDYYAEKYGTCHTVYREAYYKDGDAVLSDGRIKETAVLQHIGHSYINSRNKDKPYIFVAGVSENYSDLVSVRLTKGRMPKKADEIVLPEHLLSFAAEKYDVGDKILLDVGKRYVGEKFLPQHENLEEGEKLADTEKMTFTVVGLMERPSTLTEELYDPGFTAYTVQRSGNYPRDIYVKMNNMRSTYKISNELEKSKLPQRTANEDSAEYSDTRIFMPNSSLLEVYNINETEQMSTFSILMSMAVVLLAVIMVGSVMLIHNAFSISVGERIKQYGILKSVGATKKQIRQSVLFEAFLLCAAAVPVGVISGIIGISLTFRYLMQDFAKVLGEDVITISGNIKITPDFWAILAAVAISFLTALISAYIPARKVVKKSPIEAIRQSETVSVKAKKLRTSRLSYKLFGLEGMLADKYYKRSKKKYRTVVLSLFVSVVLFISASAMCDYMVKNVQMEYGEVPKSDVDAGYSNLSEESIKKICNVLDATKEVDEYAFVHDDLADAVIPNELFNREYAYWEIKEYQLHGAYTSPVQGEFVPDMFVRFKFIEDEKFKAFLKEKHLDEEDFFNPNEPGGALL